VAPWLIIAILRDLRAGQEMGRAGRKRVLQEFPLDRMVVETQALSTELLSKRGRRTGRQTVAG
jgi:hypothetical protein